MMLRCADRGLDLSRPRVMGVLNVTPDSFSDGGRWLDPELALERAWAMVEAGAALVDIGGESTRPGAAEVALDEESRRVLPLLERLAPALPVPISVDTRKPELMRRALAAGAGLVNDICALQEPEALAAVATSGAAVCLMHMQGAPRTMQLDPHYGDVVAEVRDFLAARIAACEAAGIARERLLIDPGFGFGKTLAHNLSLLKHLDAFATLGVPLLIGVSRKAMIGAVLDRPVDERMVGSVAAALLAAERGARIVRVHDVAETVQALQILDAVEAAH